MGGNTIVALEGKRKMKDRQELRNHVLKSRFGKPERLVDELERIYREELDIREKDSSILSSSD